MVKRIATCKCYISCSSLQIRRHRRLVCKCNANCAIVMGFPARVHLPDTFILSSHIHYSVANKHKPRLIAALSPHSTVYMPTAAAILSNSPGSLLYNSYKYAVSPDLKVRTPIKTTQPQQTYLTHERNGLVIYSMAASALRNPNLYLEVSPFLCKRFVIPWTTLCGQNDVYFRRKPFHTRFFTLENSACECGV